MTKATSTRENTRANTAPPVKASGQKASLLTANAPNADERLQRQRRRHTSLRCHLLPTELKSSSRKQTIYSQRQELLSL